MEKIYQPIVIEKTNQILSFLEDSGFYKEFEITNIDFARTYLCDVLTDKLIEGKINMELDEIFTESEFDTCLKEILAGCIMTQLKKKGIVDSYEDENTEERFFITEKGTHYLNELKKNNLL